MYNSILYILDYTMTRWIQKAIRQVPKPPSSQYTTLQIPFYRPSLFYPELIDKKYPTFQEKLICLLEMEKQPIYYDFTAIARYYIDAYDAHCNRYADSFESNLAFYKKEVDAHKEFVNRIYQMYQFRMFVGTILEFTHQQMPVHLSYYVNIIDEYSRVEPLERKRRKQIQPQYTLKDVMMEEEDRKDELMSLFQSIRSLVYVVNTASTEQWNHYMQSVFGPYPYVYQSSKYNYGQIFMRIFKYILNDMQTLIEIKTTHNGVVVHMTESEQYVPVTTEMIMEQYEIMKQWLTKMYAYLEESEV